MARQAGYDLVNQTRVGMGPVGAGDQTLKKDAGKLPAHLIAPEALGRWAFDQAQAEMMKADPNPTRVSVLDAVEGVAFWWSRGKSDLVLQRALNRVGNWPGLAAVLAFGAQKYSARGWEVGIPYSRVYAAFIRHTVFGYLAGEMNDPETGLPHLDHAACNVHFLIAFEARGRTDLDDRPKVKIEAV
jgi:hypothetical protein